MRKGELIEGIEVVGMADEGKTVAKQNGQVIFVEGAVPGDTVTAEVRKIKSTYLEARAIEITKSSERRVDPFCRHFGICGGCRWQHMNYESQLAFKQQRVIDALERIGGVSIPPVNSILPSEDIRLYRNRLDFTFSSRRWLTEKELDVVDPGPGLGFHIPRHFDKVLDLSECHLQPAPSNEIRLCVRETALKHDIPFYDLRQGQGYLRTLTVRTASTGEVMVILQVFGDREEWLHIVLDELKRRFPMIVSLLYIINTKPNDTFHDQDVHVWHGRPYIIERMNEPSGGKALDFRVGPKSFFQTNSRQAERLYKVVWDLAQLTAKEIVYDLYTGTGTIACYVSDGAKKVIGVENVSEAIDDARVNAELNGIPNTEFLVGDTKKLISEEFFEMHGRPDVIITDPPRAGMPGEVCRALADSGASRIVYVSCNPATQARDLKILCEKYRIVTIQPVDMFPHTDHVENVVLLEAN